MQNNRKPMAFTIFLGNTISYSAKKIFYALRDTGLAALGYLAFIVVPAMNGDKLLHEAGLAQLATMGIVPPDELAALVLMSVKILGMIQLLAEFFIYVLAARIGIDLFILIKAQMKARREASHVSA